MTYIPKAGKFGMSTNVEDIPFGHRVIVELTSLDNPVEHHDDALAIAWLTISQHLRERGWDLHEMVKHMEEMGISEREDDAAT